MPLTDEQLREELADEYFDMLESNGIEYVEYDQVSIDPPHSEGFVKPEYDLSDDEMAQELGYKNYQDWRKNYDK